MGILMQTAGQRFLQEAMGAFTRSPLETALVTLFVLSLLAALVAYYIVNQRREYKKLRDASLKFFDRAAEKYHLSPSHKALMLRIAEAGTRPDKRHLVFEDESLFNRGVAALQDDDDFAHDSVSALRLKLGFTRHGGVPISSVSLPIRAQVVIAIDGNPTVVPAVVLEQRHLGLVIKLEQPWSRLGAGRRVRVLYQSSTGVYSFLTAVLKVKGRLVLLRHSEHVHRSQRRQYYRREIAVPIGVAPQSGSHLREALTHDLGGGGLSFECDDLAPSVGEKLFVQFDEPIAASEAGPRDSSAICRVIRISEGDVVHTQFVTIRERLRDRIIQYLFSFRSGSAPTSSSSHRSS